MGITSEEWMTGTLMGVPTTACLIGELVAVWAFLEHTLPKPLSVILNISEPAAEAVLFALNNTSARLDIIRTVADRHAPEERKAAYRDALDEVERAAKARNAYMHQLMGYTADKRLVRWDFRSDMSKPQRRVYVRDEDINDLILQVRDACNLLTAATYPDMGPPPPSQSRRFQQRASPVKVEGS